jgi:O-antigen/teichoic acid export membrane protein
MSKPLPSNTAGILMMQAATQTRRNLAWGLKWSTVYVVWSLITKVARGLVVPKFIFPTQYGLFTSLGVLLSFAQYADLGMKYHLAKRLPYQLNKNGEESYNKLAGEGGTWILATSTLIALAVLVYSFRQHGIHAAFYRPALRIAALTVIAGRMREFLGTALLAREEYRWSAMGNVITDGVSLVMTIVLLYLVGLIGAVWALLICEVAGTAYMFRRCRIRLRMPELADLWRRLHESTLLLIISLMDTALITVDQLFLLKFFTKEQYGIYSLGLPFAAIALSLTAIFQTTIQPRILGLAGEDRHPEAHRLVDSGITLYLLAVIASLAALVPTMAVFVQFYLPKYASGVSTYVLVAGFALVRGPAILLRPFYLSANREKRLLGFQVLALALAGVVDGFVIWMGGGITSVAVASFCAYTLISCLMLLDFERASAAAFSYSKYVMLALGTATILVTRYMFRTGSFPRALGPYILHALSGTLLFVLVLLFVGLSTWRQLIRAAQLFLTH